MERILLVDDEPIFRMGLRSVISWEELGCQIVGEAKNGEEALIQIEEKKPDIVDPLLKRPYLYVLVWSILFWAGEAILYNQNFASSNGV